MRSPVLIGLVSCAALAACFDSSSKLSKEDEQLFDAVMYAFTGIEDNTQDSYDLTRRRHGHSAADQGGDGATKMTHHSALTDWTVQVVGTFPTPPDDATVVPFMNHIAVLPLVSRHKRSLMPSPL
jgi:hypothetical protein